MEKRLQYKSPEKAYYLNVVRESGGKGQNTYSINHLRKLLFECDPKVGSLIFIGFLAV